MIVLVLAGIVAFGAPAFAQQGRAFAAVDTKGFVGVMAGYEAGIGDCFWIGAFAHGAALSMAQGDIDTVEVGANARGVAPVGGFELEAELRASYGRQGQVLGLVRTVSSSLRVGAFRSWNAIRLGLEASLSGAALTDVRFSDFAKATFAAAGTGSPPEGATLYFASGRLEAGPVMELNVGRGAIVYLRGGAAYTPNPFVSGFDGMAFGLFPFYAEAGLRVPVGSKGKRND